MITIRSTVQPLNKTFTHAIVIANDLARSGDEVDSWRLLDLKQNRVTFVDDIAKTIRTESIDSLVKQRNRALAADVPASAPRAEVAVAGANVTIRAGSYQRSLSFSQRRDVPPQLFSMLHASEDAVGGPFDGVMRSADEALLAMRGFPMTDHAELAYGNRKMVIDRQVVSIEQRDVPQSWLVLRAGYRDVTAPAASPPPVSSPPRGRTTPAAGLPPSATGRTAP